MIEIVIIIFFGYLGIGVLFAILFALRGVAVVDPVAKGGSVWFKLLLIPGATALWPVLLFKWFKASRR